MKTLILLALPTMIFLHIVADFNMQGILAKMKQKEWWDEQTEDELYKNDYIVALLAHGLSWSFVVHLPIIVTVALCDKYLSVAGLLISLLAHAAIHAGVDHDKANRHIINLAVDQFLHLVQIFGIWGAGILMVCFS